MKPVLQALILARLVEQLASGAMVIVGTFNAVRLSREKNGGVPKNVLVGGKPGSPYAYISLTDVCDGTKVALQFVSLKRNKVIFQQEITIPCQDRLATIEIVAPLPHLNVSEAGTYAFEIVCEGEIIGSSRVTAAFEDSEASDSTEGGMSC